MINIKLYDSKNCPCPSDCKRRGKCRECCEFHHNRGDQTYCEYMVAKVSSDNKAPASPERSIASGRKLRLLDYGPCAG